MFMQVVTALLWVAAGIAAALALFWILNKIAELMPGKWEDRVKPFLFILTAYFAITLYLI